MRLVSPLVAVLFVGAAGWCAESVESISLDPPVLLPDGSEFLTWENATAFTKTYHVNRHHPQASDDNPGTADAPFLTINRAAQVVRAGQRVLIESGVYREQITPRFGGDGPGKMISYEAAPGARVVIKGSRLVPSPWRPSRNPRQFSEKLWMTTLPATLFERENPFALENASAADIEIMPWATEWAGRVPYTLKRGLVFQNGQRLAQLATYEDLVRLPGSYWVAADALTLHIHPFEKQNPNDAIMEVTVQQHLFKPDVTDLGYIRINGLTFMHAGNGYPRTGVGAIFTMGGHHWIIEDNTVSQVGSVGIEIGTRSLESRDRQASRADAERAHRSPGCVIVRRNELSDCGTGGIQGLEVRRALVEDNRISHSGWQDVERYWETAGIKLLVNEKTLVRRNVIAHFQAGSAIWLDWNNRNCRITQNLAYDIWMCCNGALFVEASQTPNMIDHNILWDIRGTGIYAGDTDNLIIAHNLIGACTGLGVHTRVATDRRVNGRRVTSRDNRVVQNLFYEVAAPIRFEDEQNQAERNVFVEPSERFDVAAWQDGANVTMDMDLDFDPATLQLHWSAPALPQSARIDGMAVDYHGAPRPTEAATCGPFQSRFAGPVTLNVSPPQTRR
ncbi:MAG: right-handed parallel beta-helix repeat-containing protein [Phycisphaerales bacterium]|nr:MAG: right-handed parallel beta-helix repeat-containing protein [Phycisphaerales bacterium]